MDCITLDVGGSRFVTSRATLTRRTDSFFNRLVLWPDDGVPKLEHFIDRDGKHFRYILNFLRDGQVELPAADAQLHRELAREADFYQLPELKAQALAALARAHDGAVGGVTRLPTKVLQVLPSMGAVTAYALSWDANKQTLERAYAEAQRETGGMVELVPLANDFSLSFPLAPAPLAWATERRESHRCTSKSFNPQLPLWRRVRELEAEGYKLHTVQSAGPDGSASLVVLTLDVQQLDEPAAIVPLA